MHIFVDRVLGLEKYCYVLRKYVCKIDLDFCPVAGLYYATTVLLLELVPRGHYVQFCENSSKRNLADFWVRFMSSTLISLINVEVGINVDFALFAPRKQYKINKCGGSNKRQFLS
jgi:hypothetical protein